MVLVGVGHVKFRPQVSASSPKGSNPKDLNSSRCCSVNVAMSLRPFSPENSATMSVPSPANRPVSLWGRHACPAHQRHHQPHEPTPAPARTKQLEFTTRYSVKNRTRRRTILHVITHTPIQLRTPLRSKLNRPLQRGRFAKRLSNDHFPINPRIRENRIIERSNLVIRRNHLINDRLNRNTPLRRLQINIRTPIQKTLQQPRLPHKIMLTLRKQNMQRIDTFTAFNMRRIRAMIQHPVHNLNPPRQILIPTGPQEKMFPIKIRILIKRSFEIIERTTSNSTIGIHAIPPNHESFH